MLPSELSYTPCSCPSRVSKARSHRLPAQLSGKGVGRESGEPAQAGSAGPRGPWAAHTAPSVALGFHAREMKGCVDPPSPGNLL